MCLVNGETGMGAGSPKATLWPRQARGDPRCLPAMEHHSTSLLALRCSAVRSAPLYTCELSFVIGWSSISSQEFSGVASES